MPATKWENVFVSHVPNKGLHPVYYKEFLQLIRKIWNKKCVSIANQHLTKEDTHIPNKHKERFSLSLAVRKMKF